MTTELSGLPPQFEVQSSEESLAGVHRFYRLTIREQAQVMSSALQNNYSLWHTNKALRRQNEQLLANIVELRFRVHSLEGEIARLGTPEQLTLHDLRDQVTLLTAHNLLLKNELTASMIPELDSEGRRAKVAQLIAQEEELRATGLVPSDEEINREDNPPQTDLTQSEQSATIVEPTGA
jgi:hypothetical protein